MIVPRVTITSMKDITHGQVFVGPGADCPGAGGGSFPGRRALHSTPLNLYGKGPTSAIQATPGGLEGQPLIKLHLALYSAHFCFNQEDSDHLFIGGNEAWLRLAAHCRLRVSVTVQGSIGALLDPAKLLPAQLHLEQVHLPTVPHWEWSSEVGDRLLDLTRVLETDEAMVVVVEKMEDHY